jgi:signal transduction histidine kinase
MLYINSLHVAGDVPVDRTWTLEFWEAPDVFVAAIIFMIIAIVSWLANREIERSLLRARASEKELKYERDMLETRVEERTKELKEMQSEKIHQLSRFAEFGRLSTGLFHDLINPLNAVSLNMEKLKHGQEGECAAKGTSVAGASEYVEKAVRASKKLEDLVAAVRRQLTRKEHEIAFVPKQEILDVIDLLAHKAQKACVEVRFSSETNMWMEGDAIKFNQIALNLVGNAVDAYTNIKKDLNNAKREVRIRLRENDDNVELSVQDFGVGISENCLKKIFEPFYTTKHDGKGIGIGLSMTKYIVEDDFHGSIVVKSSAGEGTEFVVLLPISKKK